MSYIQMYGRGVNILTDKNYVRDSLTVDLFFLRIMKEHGFMFSLAFPPLNVDLINEAKQFNLYYNSLLKDALKLAAGTIAITDYMVTDFTLTAEKMMNALAGASIDTGLTVAELNLATEPHHDEGNKELSADVCALNKEILTVTENFIDYQSRLIDDVGSCKVLSEIYPDMLDHMREEAVFFTKLVTKCDYRIEDHNPDDFLKQELFWNHIMAEHARYLRGLLDPEEAKLIKIANYFSHQYDELLANTMNIMSNDRLAEILASESFKLTKEFQEFKVQNAEGILNCQIRSIISPLLIDHILREANFYLHVLESMGCDDGSL